MVIDGETPSVEGAASADPSQPASDFSALHGFQFLGAREESPSEGAADDSRRVALELDARAARFHQAVDSSIVVASDGTIRWLGDSVAKIAAGDDLLTPKIILLVDEAISADARATVAARLELWLKATILRLLGPLFALRVMQEGSAQLQALAVKIADALGVLERETVRGVVRGLDQNSRAILRKQGVRFGSHYLYVPSTLRPAARALALQLTCLRRGEEQFAAAAQGLIPMASSGRTSAPLDVRVSPETYRIGGFRICGDRVVRVDIVERLADMIRAASTLRIVAGQNSGAAVFQVGSQMTSLTGCSGDGFHSILRALGFESLSVARGEIAWPAPATPAAPPAESTPPDAAAAEGEGSGDTASSEEAPAAGSPVAEASAEETQAEEAQADAPQAEDGAQPAEVASPSVDADRTDPEAPPPDPPTETEPAQTLHAEAPAEPPPQASAAPPQSVEEPITVWRFVRASVSNRQRLSRASRRPHARPRPTAQPHGASETGAGGADAVDRTHEGAGRGERQAPARSKSFAGPKRVKRTWDFTKTRRPSEPTDKNRVASDGGSSGDRKPAVDPMSPFAKLMELRAILESESKKRS
ncbi:MAG TPA: hypothetical protein VEH77_02840 [Roseiarcus sp.]|nr:hypothetical protein [Roseiarcus sp.]